MHTNQKAAYQFGDATKRFIAANPCINNDFGSDEQSQAYHALALGTIQDAQATNTEWSLS